MMTLAKYKKLKAQFHHDIQSAPTEYLRCRDVKHAWDGIDDFFTVNPKDSGAIYREMICVRCGTARTDWFVLAATEGLVKTSTSYSYPEDYKIAGMSVIPSAMGHVRAEQLKRKLEGKK